MADPILILGDGGYVLKLPEVVNDPTDTESGITGAVSLLYFQKNVGPRVKRFGMPAENLFLSSSASAADAILEIRRGAALGVASLDAGAKVPVAQISEVMAITDLSDVAAKSGTGTTVLFQSAPSITSPDITTSVTMASDNNVDIGTATKRVKTISVMSDAIKVFNASADANAVLTLGNGSVKFGAGGASAQDTRLVRSGAGAFTIDNGAGGAGSLTVTGDLTVQGTTTTINSTVVDIKDRVIHMNHDTGTATTVPALMTGFSIHRGAVAGTSRSHAAMVWVNDSAVVDAASGTGYFILCSNSLGDDSTVGAPLQFHCGTLTIGANARLILSDSGLGSACTYTIYNQGGQIVTASGTQTLANKTLTTPTISGTGYINAKHAHTASNSGGTLGLAIFGALGSGNQMMGMNAGAAALEYKTLIAGTNISAITHGVGSVTITGSTTPTISDYTNARTGIPRRLPAACSRAPRTGIPRRLPAACSPRARSARGYSPSLAGVRGWGQPEVRVSSFASPHPARCCNIAR